MKKIILVPFIAIFAFACTPGENGATSQTDTLAADARGEMVDGIQVVHIEAAAEGFDPARIELEAGVPARLVFTRTSRESCAETISVPDFGIEDKPLPVGEAVTVEFTPQEAGEFAFACGMDMQEGALVVKG